MLNAQCLNPGVPKRFRCLVGLRSLNEAEISRDGTRCNAAFRSLEAAFVKYCTCSHGEKKAGPFYNSKDI